MARKKIDWNAVSKQLEERFSSKKDSEGSNKDDRFWNVTKNEAGAGAAIIRFLPDKSLLPYVMFYEHRFEYDTKSGRKFYYGKCRTSIGEDCPICEKNRDYWNSGFEADKKIARDRKRKKTFISNILVVKDPGNPENEGKVFLFKYGTKIFEKLEAAWHGTPDMPEVADDTYPPFDPWEGADFKIIVKKIGDYPNYDSSAFLSKSELFGGDDEKIEAVLKKTYDLEEFMKPDSFPTYEQVKKELSSIFVDFGGDTGTKEVLDPHEKSEDDIPDDIFDETNDIKETDDENSLENNEDSELTDLFKNLS